MKNKSILHYELNKQLSELIASNLKLIGDLLRENLEVVHHILHTHNQKCSRIHFRNIALTII